MHRTNLVILVCLVIFTLVGCEQKQQEPALDLPTSEESAMDTVRLPAVAGQFYSADATELSSQIETYLDQADSQLSDKKPRMIIVPHAGYPYSAGVAAYAYKTIQPHSYNSVVLIGVSHTTYLEGAALYATGSWQTPLGTVEINEDLAIGLMQSNLLFQHEPQAHSREHSLEVQLPFLQTVLEPGFRILPILLSGDSAQAPQELADSLLPLIDDQTLIVISTDLSHYPEYEVANQVDASTIEAALSIDVNIFRDTIIESESSGIKNLSTAACGAKAIETAIYLANSLEQSSAEFLHYANSGDVSIGDREQVVGYASIAIYGAIPENQSAVISDQILNDKEQKQALAWARKTIDTYLATGQKPTDPPPSQTFERKLGAFVTLHKDSQLRGCIGSFEPDISLWEVIRDMAVAAATEDPRFVAATEDELELIELEISVLSEMQQIDDPNLVEVGRHGVYVKKGTRGGTYLPQVATEADWNRQEFLTSLCRDKAGIGADDWRTGEADLYIYTAQVFSE